MHSTQHTPEHRYRYSVLHSEYRAVGSIIRSAFEDVHREYRAMGSVYRDRDVEDVVTSNLGIFSKFSECKLFGQNG